MTSTPQNRYSPKPKERSPPVGSGVDKSTSKDDGEQVSKSVSLLQHAGNQAAGFQWYIFECGGGSVAIQPTHGDTKACANAEELAIRLAETGCLGGTSGSRWGGRE